MAIKKLVFALGAGIAVSVASQAHGSTEGFDRQSFCNRGTAVERSIKKAKYRHMFDYRRFLRKFGTELNATTVYLGMAMNEANKEAGERNPLALLPPVPLKAAVALADSTGLNAIAMQTFWMCNMPNEHAEYLQKEAEAIEGLFKDLKEALRVLEKSEGKGLEDRLLATLERLRVHVVTARVATAKTNELPQNLEQQEKEALQQLDSLFTKIERYLTEENAALTISKAYMKNSHAPDQELELNLLFNSFKKSR